MKTLYTNGQIHTLRRRDEVFACMGVENGRITWLADSEPGDAAGWDRVDLQKGHVFPALTDSHLHLLYSIVLAASSFTLCQVRDGRLEPDTLAGVEQSVRAWCRANPRQKLLVANGYVTSAIAEKRLPTRQELDDWTGGRRAVIYNIDGHSSAMSTALMRALKIPEEGHDGIFAGEAHEFIQGRVTGLIASSVTPGVLARGIGRFTDQCARYGIGRVCALDGNEDLDNDWLTAALAFLARRMEIDVRLFPQFTSPEKAARFFRAQSTPRMGGCGAWELDGSVGSHSAAFDLPYKDRDDTGHCYRSEAFVRSRLAWALENGVQFSCHAIGSMASRQIVDLYTEQLPAASDPNAPLNRIDHCEFPGPEEVERLKTLPLAVTVQPGFSWLDKRYLKSYEHFLRPEAIRRQIPLRELAEAGVCLCGSSDSPVQSIDPYAQMLGMVEYYLPEKSLTPWQALCSYTVNPARMLGEAAATGTLEPGKEASFFVCDQDLTVARPEELANTQARYTVVRGTRLRPHAGTVGELLRLLLRRPRKI